MSAAATAERADWWGQGQDDATVIQLAATRLDGNELIAGLRSHPHLDLSAFEVDFNSSTWRFTSCDGAFDGPKTPVVRFKPDGSEDIWKLWLVCLTVWEGSKVRTHIKHLYEARRVFNAIAGGDVRHTTIDLEQYLELSEARTNLSRGYRYSQAISLLRFLEFRHAFFGVPNDPEMMSRLRDDAKQYGRSLTYSVGTPSIDDEYLVPLVETCHESMADEDEQPRYRIAAAALLLAAQIGMRISEARTLEADKLEIASMEGKPDIAFITFKTYKGARGDEGYKTVESIINPIALSAYLFLEGYCSERRKRVGTDALIVTPEQKGSYPSQGTFANLIKEFILVHHATIPCIGTEDRFPDMQISKVETVARRAKKRPSAIGLTGDETLVYPKFHSFRSTVATKLYESGVDMRYIRRHMGHMDENTTAGYIRSDREIEQRNNDLVYKAVFGDGAEFIGPHGGEFQQMIAEYASKLPEKVKGDLDELVAATSKAFPLRRKVGGVCIRCGRMAPCPSNTETDQIYCAFGVCPNQCVLYFFADQCLETVRSHMELIPINTSRGQIMAARNELRKAQNIIRDSLVPELDSLERQLDAHGREHIIGQFPELEELIDTLPEVRKEIAEWQAMSI
ncbi:MAG: site-specific integrase [Atopobiaceae bacterium]|nr:site-specific integrase [Atopobiaceae bacterium]